jgi:virginiamycin A acetyltransferase
MLYILKLLSKRILLKSRKSIVIDLHSDVNYNVINNSFNPSYPCRIIKSKCNLKIVNEGCNITESRCYGDIILGRFVGIEGPGTVIKSLKEEIYIGSFSSIGQNVCIVDFNHSFGKISSSFIHHLVFKEKFITDLTSKGPVIIEEDVFIGSNSVVLPGVRIGRGSVIGAGSVVTKDIPKYSIAVGNPAMVISKRFDDSMIEYIEKLKWWEWDIKKIIKNKNLFSISINNYNENQLNSNIKMK